MFKHIRNKKSLILLCLLPIACFLSAGIESPASGKDNVSGHFYYSDGKKIQLNPSSEYIAVRFKPGRSATLSKNFNSMLASGRKKQLAKNRLTVFNLKQGIKNDNISKMQNDLRNDPGIELVAPVFKAKDASMIVTDEFIIQFKPYVSENLVSSLCSSYNVEAVEKVSWSENTYILRVKKGDCLNTANTFHGLKDVVYAHPNFVRMMSHRPLSLRNLKEEVIIGPDGEILPAGTKIEKGTNSYKSVRPVSITLSEPIQTSQIAPFTPVSHTTLKTETFESTFPNTWILYSDDPTDPLWDKESYRSYSGSYSGYCVGSSVAPPGPYPDDVETLMIYGPFSLSDAVDARLNLQMWVDVEAGYDYVSVLASGDGISFSGHGGISGDWASASGGTGFMNVSLDLKSVPDIGDLMGDSTVWVALLFGSDESVGYEGVYADDIIIEKITGGYESLTTDTYDHLQWSLSNNGQLWGDEGVDISAPDAWGITHGSSSIIIAIIDEGVDLTHPDLSGKMVTGYDATDGGLSGAPQGDDAHGTNCAGIAAASTNNSIGVAGIAREASIMPIRIAYGDGADGWITSDAWIADGIAWAVTNGADVLSNSWGGGTPSTTITNAIADAKTNGRGGKGCIVVFSSGNDNDAVSYPATLSNVLAVGAISPCNERKAPTSCDGEFWWGSNYGAELDIMAPGVHMYSTDIQGASGYDSGNYFYDFNGTSSAAPVVSGVAALILGLNPDLTATQVEHILTSTADDMLTSGWDQYTGHGRVNAYEALLRSSGGGGLPAIFNLLLLD